MRRRICFGGRDQALSKFAATLGRLCDAVYADAAALVDGEGETVDYAGTLSPYDTKVAAAEWQLVLTGLRATQLHGSAYEVMVRASCVTYAAFAVSEGYALVLQLPRRCFGISRRAVGEAMRELCVEAGLELPARFAAEQWSHVDVREATHGRPLAMWIDQAWARAQVIGRIHSNSLQLGESAFRVMLESGYETNLVRERLGRWYREEEP